MFLLMWLQTGASQTPQQTTTTDIAESATSAGECGYLTLFFGP